MYIVFLVILAIIFAIVPILDALPSKKPKNAVVTEKMQCKSYFRLILFLWGLTIPIFIMSFIGNISLADIGFRPISFNHNIWLTVVALIISGLAFAYFIYELISSLISKKIKEQFREEYANDSQGALSIIPRTKKEKRLYSLVALSSAICEETVYRGFLFFLLQTIFPNMPVFLIILIGFVTFGIGHLYQGLKGAISTGLFAALSMGLLIVTDSLIPVILLHFVAESSSIFVFSKE